jgi:hypothetical protein
VGRRLLMVAQAQLQRETASRETSSALRWVLTTCGLMMNPSSTEIESGLLVRCNAVNRQAFAYAISQTLHSGPRRMAVKDPKCLVDHLNDSTAAGT